MTVESKLEWHTRVLVVCFLGQWNTWANAKLAVCGKLINVIDYIVWGGGGS